MDTYSIPATIRFEADSLSDAERFAESLSTNGKEPRNWAQETLGSFGMHAHDTEQSGIRSVGLRAEDALSTEH